MGFKDLETVILCHVIADTNALLLHLKLGKMLFQFMRFETHTQNKHEKRLTQNTFFVVIDVI